MKRIKRIITDKSTAHSKKICVNPCHPSTAGMQKVEHQK